MSSYPSFSDSISGVQYQSGSQFSFQFSQLREEIPMDLDQEWMTNVDPQLKNVDESAFLKQWSEQPLQRFLGEPQKPLFTTQPYPSQQYEDLHQDFNSSHNGPAPFPYVYNRQICSPAPSSQERYSICSSALSPNSADNEWSKESFQPADAFQLQENFDSSPLSRSTSHTSQGLPDLIWPSKPFPHQLEQTPGGVSLSQLQGIPDQGDLVYQEDEGYGENVEMATVKSELADHAEDTKRSSIKHEKTLSYHQTIDEALGNSLKDESSPSRRSSYQSIDLDADADAEGDIDADADAEIDDEALPTEPVDDDDDDDEYRPRSTATTSARRRRRATFKSSPTSPIITKRSKISKSPPTNKNHHTPSPFQCPSCSKNNFANSAALTKHISSVHTRAFVCAFGFAGCESRFASKNEWKRHVSSQHLCLNYWRCEVSMCGKGASSTSSSPSQSRSNISNDDYNRGERRINSRSGHDHSSPHHHGNSTKTNEFNRKDLFTQHLRRMHAPFAVKRQGKKVDIWEERVRELQASSLRVRREAPWRTRCPVQGCDDSFEGKGSWDERMEHVGKHLEKIGGGAGSGTPLSKIESRIHKDIAEGVDDDLLEWSLREGIVEEKAGGGWRLCGVDKTGTLSNVSSSSALMSAGYRTGAIKREYDIDGEADAEGEDDI